MPPHFRRAFALATLALLTFAGPPTSARAQSPLVLQKGTTREFHNPWCPVVRDGKDVLALTRAQASARRLSAHAACARDPGGDPPPAAPVFVQVDGSKYYHRAGCARLAARNERQPLAAAGKTRWPCPACRPPIRKGGS